MSRLVLQLIIIGGIALLLINRLISLLGRVDEDELIKKQHGLYDITEIKDVTETGRAKDLNAFSTKNNQKIDEDLILKSNSAEILPGIEELNEKLPSFDLRKFVVNATSAVKIIAEALKNKDKKALEILVDSRFRNKIEDFSAQYDQYNQKAIQEVKISRVNLFGNNVFINVMISLDLNNRSLLQEWTFSKHLNYGGPEWYLTNIVAIE